MIDLEYEVRAQIAGRRLDLISPDCVVAWAGEALAEGHESAELVALASIGSPSAELVDSALGRLSASLSIEPSTVGGSVELLVMIVVRKILAGDVDVFEGAREVLRIDARGDGLPALYPIRAILSEADSDRTSLDVYRDDLFRAIQNFADSSQS